MSWTTDQVSMLIQEYQKYPALYMVKHADYHNKHRRNLCLEKIVSSLAEIRPNSLVVDIHKKFSGLRSTYATERRKHVESLKSGTGHDDVYRPSLWYFEKMKFLDEHLGIRQSKGSAFAGTSRAADEAHVTEGEDVASGAEQYELADISESEEILSPVASTSAREIFSGASTSARESDHCSSAAHSPTPTPRKRMRQQEKEPGTEGGAATTCLQDISTAMQTYVAGRSPAAAPDGDAAYASVVHARLAQIKNVRRKQRLMYAVDTLFFKALEEERDEVEQNKQNI